MTEMLKLGLCCLLAMPNLALAQDSATGHDSLSALKDKINAEDRGISRDAATEYQRRLALLPAIANWQVNGNPNDPDFQSLHKLQDELREINNQMSEVRSSLQKLQELPEKMRAIPIEFTGIKEMAIKQVIMIPGPQPDVSNPSPTQLMLILFEQKAYWTIQLNRYQERLDTMSRQLDGGNTNVVVDALGDVHPESLLRWKSQEQQRLRSAHAVAATAKLIPEVAYQVIQAAKSEAAIAMIDKVTFETAPLSQAGIGKMTQAIKGVLGDKDQDWALVRNGNEDEQTIISRKTVLLRDRLLPALETMKNLLENVAVPTQQESIGAVTSEGEVIRAKQDLLRQLNSDVRQNSYGLGSSKALERLKLYNEGQISLGELWRSVMTPSPNVASAPYGDKGVERGIESLRPNGEQNYMSRDFHRFIQEPPSPEDGK